MTADYAVGRADHATASASSPAPSARPPSTRRWARRRWPAPSAEIVGGEPLRHPGASPTRSAWPASPPGRPPPTRSRWPGAPPSTPSWSRRWPRDRRATCARSASTRASRPSWTSSATRAGAGSRRRSARTRTWSARSAPAYVRGLESARDRRHAQALRRVLGLRAAPATSAPVAAGVREFADVILPPFEMALREGGARSVMAAYTEIDGVPAVGRPAPAHRTAAGGLGLHRHGRLRLLRHRLPGDAHRVAGTPARGRGAGPGAPASTSSCRPCAATASRWWRPSGGRGPRGAGGPGRAPGAAQKCELGLLDEDWQPEPRRRRDRPGPRPRTARWPARLAEESVVLLDNAGRRAAARARTPGSPWSARAPTTPLAMLGCYSFPPHVGAQPPRARRWASTSPRCCEALRAELPDAKVTYAPGLRGRRRRTPAASRRRWRGPPEARRLRGACSATGPGLFGRGTSGEGCDAADLRLPGVQAELLDALLATGRRWCWSCSPAARTRWAAGTGRLAARRPGVLPRARRAARRWPACCRAASTRRGGCR